MYSKTILIPSYHSYFIRRIGSSFITPPTTLLVTNSLQVVFFLFHSRCTVVHDTQNKSHAGTGQTTGLPPTRSPPPPSNNNQRVQGRRSVVVDPPLSSSSVVWSWWVVSFFRNEGGLVVVALKR